MKFLIDMNMSPRWAEEMRLVGIEAVHWSSLGSADASDPEIMTYAEEHGYIVFTNDLDFGHLLAMSNAAQPSVVQIRLGNLRPNVIGSEVMEALKQMKIELESGALVTIDANRTRVRVLPLERAHP